MKDIRRLNKITRPIKFRRLKIVKWYVKDCLSSVIDNILYYYNYILYKLHYLDRYTYRDTTIEEKEVPLYKRKEIETDLIRATVEMKLEIENQYDVDYFHRGNKITYIVRDERKSRSFFVSHLSDISIRVTEDWAKISQLPIFKVAVLKPLKSNLEEQDPNYRTVDIDVSYIRNLRVKHILGDIDSTNISEEMVKYYYDYDFEQFLGHLKPLKLSDLIV